MHFVQYFRINTSVFKSSISYFNRSISLSFQTIKEMTTQITSSEEANRLIEMGKKASAYQAIDENVNKVILIDECDRENQSINLILL